MDTDGQRTIAKPVSLSGRGLFGGTAVTMTFEPAPVDYGVVFARSDLGGVEVAAIVDNVVQQPRRTTLRSGKAVVETCEHCLGALAGLKIDNVKVTLDSPELPAGDGSARPFIDVLNEAGINADASAPRHRFKVTEPVMVRDGDATLAAMPCDEPAMFVTFDLDFGQGSPISRQVQTYDSANGDFASKLASARTFCLEQEAIALQEAGYCKHLTEKDALVIGPNGPISNAYRFQDEPVRHKIVDLVGDLYLLGVPIEGQIFARKSNHALNHKLVRALIEQHRSSTRQYLANNASAVDIRSLMRILPHRYPMLLVDRVLEIEQDKRIMGIKNVSVNEPYFQGHYPTAPIMPGVLVVEAMAQLSGVLIGQSLEHMGKLGVLMSLDRVKLRKPVTPGDQLVIEARTIRIRSRIAHMSCIAYVGNEIAAEAQVKYLLVDNEQE